MWTLNLLDSVNSTSARARKTKLKSGFTFLQASWTLFQPFDLVKYNCIASEMKFFGQWMERKRAKTLSSPVRTLYVFYKILHHEVSLTCCSDESTAKKCTKSSMDREQDDYFCLGFVHTILDSFLCVVTKSYPVWSPIRFLNLRFRDRRGADSLRYRNRAKITVLMCEQKPYPVWFSCRRKSYYPV